MIKIMNMWIKIYRGHPNMFVLLLLWTFLNGFILSRIWKPVIAYPLSVVQITGIWMTDIWYFHKVVGYETYDMDATISFFTVPVFWFLLLPVNVMTVWLVKKKEKECRVKRRYDGILGRRERLS